MTLNFGQDRKRKRKRRINCTSSLAVKRRSCSKFSFFIWEPHRCAWRKRRLDSIFMKIFQSTKFRAIARTCLARKMENCMDSRAKLAKVRSLTEWVGNRLETKHSRLFFPRNVFFLNLPRRSRWQTGRCKY